MGSFQKRQGGGFLVKQGRGARVVVGPGASGGDAAAVAARGDALAAAGSAASAASAASASATSAANAAALVGAPADSAIAAAISGSASATSSALGSRLADPATPLVAKLDQRAPSAVLAVLGDSTGVPPTTGKWVDVLAALVGARWKSCKVTTRLQSGAVYPAPTTVATGLISGTVATDTFTRTAADLNGTTADSGGVWTSTSTGKYAVDGAKAAFINGSTGVTAQRLPTTASGRLSTTSTLTLIFNGSSGPFGAIYVMSSYVDASNFLWMEINNNTQVITYKVSTTAGGTVNVSTSTYAAAGISASASPQSLTVKIEHVGNDVTFTVKSAAYTHTLTQSQSDTFATANSGGFWGTINDHSFDNLTVTASSPAATVLDLYNGSASSTAADWPNGSAGRLAALLPVAPDLLFINYGHNHASDTPSQFQSKVDALVSAVRVLHPGVPVTIVGQNHEKPPASGRAAHYAREASKRAWCRARGYGYLPAFEAILSKDFPDAYVQSDGVHPTVSGAFDGGQVWGQRAMDYLTAQSLI